MKPGVDGYKQGMPGYEQGMHRITRVRRVDDKLVREERREEESQLPKVLRP